MGLREKVELLINKHGNMPQFVSEVGWQDLYAKHIEAGLLSLRTGPPIIRWTAGLAMIMGSE